MNKKAISILAVVAVLLVSSTVFAVEGTYEGFPIVNVKVNGNTVQGDVPAINLNGRTMVPVRFVSESLGAQVNWNGNTNTVEINSGTPNNQNALDAFTNIQLFTQSALQTLKENGVNILTYEFSVDQYGSFIDAEYIFQGIDQKFENDIILISSMGTTLDHPLDSTMIKLFEDATMVGTVTVYHENARKYVNGNLSKEEFVNSWRVNIWKEDAQQDINTNTTIEDNEATCEYINDLYDERIANVKETLNERGILDSSIAQDQLDQIEEERERMLEQYGCE